MYGYGPKHHVKSAVLELRIPPFSSTATFGHQHHSSLECFGFHVIQASDSNKPLRHNDVVAYLPTIFILRHPNLPYPSLPDCVVEPAQSTASQHRIAYHKTHHLVPNGKAYQNSIEINQLNQTRSHCRVQHNGLSRICWEIPLTM